MTKDGILRCLGVFLIFLFLQHLMLGQGKVTGRITDKETGEPLAFTAVVSEKTNQGTYSDIDGYYEIEVKDTSDVLLFMYVGFHQKKISWTGQSELNVALEASVILLTGIEITPRVNPAEIIMRRVINNRKLNDPESGTTFRYDSYNKLIFTAELDSTVINDPAKFNSLDTAEKKAVDFLEEQYLFLMESVSQRKFMPPDRSEETIIATRVSGLQNPEFALLGTQLQSFSFYEESVEVLDRIYLSPLSDGAINKYLFILEDSTFSGVDTVYNISFRPRKGKNFEGLQGQLFINTNGYALQQVIAFPAQSNESGFNIRIQQKYELIENKKWFPVQLNSRIDMPFAKVNSLGMVGIGRSYIRNIRLGEAMRAREFTPVTLQMETMASRQPDSLWNKYREHALDQKELKTYHVIDSIGEETNLDRTLTMMQMMASGKIPIGKISIDLDRILRFNRFEGFRLGLGMHTNDFLSKKFSLGGYFAYGFHDKNPKYGADLVLNLKRKRNAWVKLIYENDVIETAGNQFDKPIGALDPSKYYQVFVNRMDRYEKQELQINARLIGNFTSMLFANHKLVSPFENYRFISSEYAGTVLFENTFEVSEAGIMVRYAPGEKLVRTGNQELRLGGRWPVFWAKFSRGLDEILNGEYSYSRLDFMLEKKFKIRLLGEFDTRFYAGKIDEGLPLSMAYNVRGSFSHYSLATPFSFETVRTNEFQHTSYFMAHFRHNFMDLLIRGKKAGPQISLVHNMVWGDMKEKNRHNVEIHTTSKGYFESGIQVDRLLRMQFSGLGIGVFYRYGPYHLPDTINNFAFKLAYSFMF